jgi:hypothetical protein
MPTETVNVAPRLAVLVMVRLLASSVKTWPLAGDVMKSVLLMPPGQRWMLISPRTPEEE